ncbi:hypothetical protein [Sporolactobacillus inulinus]|uniref:hypothetical protein n=1 Tax=Sporolactobacillus inulinus TaxID=2078 RepID=UPI0021CCA133|nr:hypothetical protein [Sporolactobacillus inulinus]
MHGLTSDKMIQDIKDRGVTDEKFAEVGIDVREWLNGFQTVENEVQKSVSIVKVIRYFLKVHRSLAW